MSYVVGFANNRFIIFEGETNPLGLQDWIYTYDMKVKYVGDRSELGDGDIRQALFRFMGRTDFDNLDEKHRTEVRLLRELFS